MHFRFLVLSFKNIYGKGATGVDQVVDHLPNKCEALSSNLNIAKKKKNYTFTTS
jgi:hypothetical protein